MIHPMNTAHPEHVQQEAARLKAIYNARKRQNKSLNQAALAELCGWASQGTVSQYMTGNMELNLEALLKLASALAFDPAEVSPRLAKLYQAANPVANRICEKNQSPYGRGRMLPVIGLVQAGAFCEANACQAYDDATEWVESGGPVGSRAFVLKVEGHSMAPKILPGELVVIDPDLAWGPGSIVLAKRNRDHHMTLKTLCQEGNEFYLEAANPDWPNRIIKMDEEWSICGRAKRKIVDL